MQWQSCPPVPLAWFELREALLAVLYSPHLLMPLVVAMVVVLAWRLRWPRKATLAVGLLIPLALSTIYSAASTSALTAWLLAQVPSPSPITTSPSPSVARGSAGPIVAVIVGRGPAIAVATTRLAAALYRQGKAVAAYVSGDISATGDLLVRQGLPPERVAGDSCARTTWENATLTSTWLHQQHPGASVLLITDPWQLARASRAFARQGLQVIPLAADPLLSPAERNRLALRETAATLLYRLQGRT